MKLRGDDPLGMKTFIQSIQSRVNELKASSESGQSNINNKRVCVLKIIYTELVICASYFPLTSINQNFQMEFMLETICDIKNNKKRSKEDTVQHTRIKKWLQKVLCSHLTYSCTALILVFFIHLSEDV